MHSRIFQLSSQPINEDDYITEDLFYDGFVGSIADYVSSDTDRESDIEWFISFLEKYGVKREGNAAYFPKGFKEIYFEKRLKELKEKVSNMTLHDFCDSFEAYSLCALIEDRYGFYIYTDSHGLMTLDDFVRNLENEDKFYFGATIDYHF